METPEKLEANIRSVLNAFQSFHCLCENDSAFNSVLREDIKDIFKLAVFIEKAMSDFQQKNCAEKFIAVLNSCKQDVYNADFYNRACDHVLSKFFQQKTLKPALVDVAVRMYTALLPKERLEAMLTDFILTSVSCKTIVDFAVVNKGVVEKDDLQSDVLLHAWSNQLKLGKSDEITETINNMMSVYKIKSDLPILVKILAVSDEDAKQVKEIVLDVLLRKMLDRSILSKHFWLAIFKDVNKQDIAKVCETHQEFLLHLSKFLIYLGSMMVNTGSGWIGDPKLSICPEITFNELLTLVRALKNHSENHKKYLCKIFKDANSNTHLPIWEEFEKSYIHEFL